MLNKIITGEFRVGASATLVVRALAQVAGVPQATMAHRVMGDWPPTAEFFTSLREDRPVGEAAVSRPYPFFLASPLEQEVEALGPREEWLAEWKWDGIRAQVVRRGGRRLPLVARRGAGHRPLPGDGGRGARACPTASSSTARSWPTATACCPSPSCRRASAARS